MPGYSPMPDQSFPATHRLRHSREFDAVFGQPDQRISRPEVLILAKHNGRGFNRLGMVISKKQFPRAVTRNLVKRTIREAFRRLPSPAESLDLVVLARRGAETDQGRGRLAGTLTEIITRAAVRAR